MNFCTPHFGDYDSRCLNAYGANNSSYNRGDNRQYVDDSTNCDAIDDYCTNDSYNRTNSKDAKDANTQDNNPNTKENSMGCMLD